MPHLWFPTGISLPEENLSERAKASFSSLDVLLKKKQKQKKPLLSSLDRSKISMIDFKEGMS